LPKCENCGDRNSLSSEVERNIMALDPFLKSILVCPKCKGDLIEETSPPGLVCESCQLVYPIREDIPIMLIEEAHAKGDHSSP